MSGPPSPGAGSAANPPEAPIGVVVVNFASSHLLMANLLGLEGADRLVVVVDNFSTREERGRVQRLAAERDWTLVESANRGFGAGVNLGAATARDLGCTSVLLLNPDVEVEADVVDELRRHLALDPMALVSPRLIDPTGRTVFEGSVLDLADGRISRHSTSLAPGTGRVGWLTAACLAVDLDLWDRVSGFNEHYFMYWEDVDFNLRCLLEGARVVLRADLEAVHDQGGTQGPRHGRAKSDLYYRYNARNRMLFAASHLPRGRLLRWLVCTPRVSYEIWLHGGRRQFLERPSGAVSAARGGLSGMLRAFVGGVRRRNLRVIPADSVLSVASRPPDTG